jgi:radical SAM protein (TIGR01212 family)
MLINKKTNISYLEFTDFLKKTFPAFKVQKISIDAGFTCPNRDGSKGTGGCTYCNNRTFNPDYCGNNKSITEQLREGIRFFSHKYPEMKYIAYFQAYTNTYGGMGDLKRKYEEALGAEDVVGIIIGTRPDCVPDELLDYLAELNRRAFVMVEYGIESSSNETLKLINRGHTYEEAEDAVRRTAKRGVHTGAHIILGLPGESREQILRHADRLSELPLTSVKLHQLQIIRGTAMEREYKAFPEHFEIYTANEYIDLVIEFMERLRKDIYIDRFVSQSPKELLVAPDWGLKNHEFRAKLEQKLASH